MSSLGISICEIEIIFTTAARGFAEIRIIMHERIKTRLAVSERTFVTSANQIKTIFQRDFAA